MKIKRLEFGISRISDKPAWKEWYFSASKAMCGCYILDVWFLYFTWMGDECYYQCNDPECECKNDNSPTKT